MNLYIHDIFVHAGLQYSESAGFRGMSCEEDESLFSKLKEIVKNLTNQHDNVLETILLRMASRSEAAIEYGPTSNAGTKENPISKIADQIPDRDCLIPGRFCVGPDFETLLETLESFGFNSSWWRIDASSNDYSFLTRQPLKEFGKRKLLEADPDPDQI